ncbi:hypothetical protein TMPK1_02690 [Rhodospirillales bacterium TMPK1]|uniref:Uncharacterized protein n=1 Tax=Roseiterribacter gracilis TaxID=2812848 RepID=A0A8S8X832_9PROT|nr:hypothetical protein TMPK1_02690 [Rhodospirillales bacterium TMPK1]
MPSENRQQGLFAARATLPQEEGFRSWLAEQGTKGRVVSDVCSRVRRTMRYVRVAEAEDGDALWSELLKNKEFRALSGAVQSQLKRAGLLYVKFLRGTRGEQ